MRRTTTAWIIAAALAATWPLGCTEELGDIDRTQPNYVKKSDLEGTWYYLQTVVKVPPTSTFTFEGETSRTEKIRWSIQEDYLIGYRSYPMVPGAEDHSTAGPDYYGEDYQENPVVAFRILKHFDRIREYNPTTGEEGNVLVENDSDRPWFERDFIRVDWSENLVTNFDFISEASTVTNLQYFVPEEAGGPDAFHHETDDQGRLSYFDFVGKMFVEPDEWGCVFTWMGWAAEDCTAGEIKVRSSFAKTPDERDYEPFHYDDNLMSKFGFFRSERVTFDPRRGQTDSGRRYMINRHDIWRETYRRAADGSWLRDDQGRRIPIPVSERETRTIPYYLSERFPDDALMEDAAQEVIRQWDDAARKGVAALQGKEVDEIGHVFVLCHNPVRAGDPEACGEPGFRVRFGDLRYSVLHWVDSDQLEGPLGYGPSVTDPVTGEIIAGKAHIYGAAVDTYTSYAMDVIRYVNEDLTDQELIVGDHFKRDLLERLDHVIDPERVHQGLGRATVEDAIERAMRQERAPLDHPEALRRGERLRRKVERKVEGHRPYSRDADELRYRALMEKGLASHVVNEEIKAMVAGRLQRRRPGPVDPGSVDIDPVDLATRLSPFEIDRHQRLFDKALSRSLDFPDMFETSALGIARRYEGRRDYDRMWRELRAKIFLATAVHEVGHTMGLRHNFMGSYDSLNYFDEYWRLRAQTMPDPDCNCFSKCDGVQCPEGQTCNGLTGACIQPDGPGCEGVTCAEGEVCDGLTGRCVRVRQESLSYLDLYRMASLTADQIDGQMRDYQYSSIMDYGYSFQSDLMGIGRYDEAAIAFGYGCGYDRVPVDDARCREPGALLLDGGSECMVQRPGPVQVFAKNQGELGEAGRLLSATETHFGHTVRYDDTNIPNVNILERYHYTTVARAFPEPSDMFDRRWMRYDDYLAKIHDHKSPPDQRPVKVPYGFCSDEWREEMLSCQYFDQGADPFEMTINKVAHWRAFYAFDNFRRNRFGWEPWYVLVRSWLRYFKPLSDYHQFWWFAEWRFDEVMDLYYEMAAYTGFNALAEVIATPPYGRYCRSRTDGSLVPLSDDASKQDLRDEEDRNPLPWQVRYFCELDGDLVEVLPGDGRRRLSRFAFDTGYYSYDRTLEAGHWWTTWAAVWGLTDPDASVIGVDAESGTYSINFYDMFDEEFARLAAGIVTEDYELFGPLYSITGDEDHDGIPDGELTFRPLAPLWVQDDTGNWIKVDPETGRPFQRVRTASRGTCQRCTEHRDCLGYTGYYGGVFCVPMAGGRDKYCLQDCREYRDCEAACQRFQVCQEACERYAASCDDQGDCDEALNPGTCDLRGGCDPSLDPGTCDAQGHCVEAMNPCRAGEICSEGGDCIPATGRCEPAACSPDEPQGACPEGQTCQEGECRPVPTLVQTDPTIMLVSDLLFWSLYDNTSGYELAYNDGFKVFRMGTGEEETADGRDFEVITFTDPIGGEVYGAIEPRCEAIRPSGGATGMCGQCEAHEDCAAFIGMYYGGTFCTEAIPGEGTRCYQDCGNGTEDRCPDGTTCADVGGGEHYCLPDGGTCQDVAGPCSPERPAGDCPAGEVCVQGVCQGPYEPNARCRHLRVEDTPAVRMVKTGQRLAEEYLEAMDRYYEYPAPGEPYDPAYEDQLRYDYYGKRSRLRSFQINLNLLRTYQSYLGYLF